MGGCTDPPQPSLASHIIEAQISAGLPAQQGRTAGTGISRLGTSSRGRVVQHESVVGHFQADGLLDPVRIFAA